MLTMKHETATATHPGQVRDLNEDRVLVKQRDSALGPPLTLLLVADGMGGHQAGEVASRIAAETIEAQLRWYMERHETEDTQPIAAADQSPVAHLAKRLQLAVAAANEAIFAYAASHTAEAGNMGTTITCALVKENHAVIANVGDSRTYQLRGGRLQQVTDDHSFVGHLVRMGELRPDEVYDHPKRSLITRALGGKQAVDVDVFTVALDVGDQLLLCSDGLWEMVRDEREIVAAMGMGAAEQAAQALVDLANRHGGEDNIAVAVVKMTADARRRTDK